MDGVSPSEIFMFLGFMLAAYSIVANDAIQTLGTFLSSNAHRPWWVLWIYACSVLVAVFVYGWLAHHGDVSYGRLARFPVPERFTLIHVIPPLAILVLTRFGVPVSTTFLVLTVFAPAALGSMLTKSLLGYVVAFGVGFLAYRFVTTHIEKRFLASNQEAPPAHWVVLQWLSTAFLWSQWLTHDLANIFVYLPRSISAGLLVASIGLMLLLHAIIFRLRGGAIQHIVTSKTNTTDIRSATIIDFIYAFILLFFKELNSMPMSTTWVFLGLLGGREVAISLSLKTRSLAETGRVVITDGLKAGAGLAVSIALAFGLPPLHAAVERRVEAEDEKAAIEAAAPLPVDASVEVEPAEPDPQEAEDPPDATPRLRASLGWHGARDEAGAYAASIRAR